MPRPLRTDAPGAVHHVMVRGVEGRTIFSCRADSEDFLARLAVLVGELEFRVLAWCLLANHAHLVLKTASTPLAVLMARLNSRHAQRFNAHHARSGHLFQDRYKAVPIESDDQLASTIPYVLGNSARHGLHAPIELRDYPWSLYGGLAGRRRLYAFEDVGAVEAALGVERRRLPALVAETARQAATLGARIEPDQLAELDRLVRDCCRRHGIEVEALRSRKMRVREVRAEICSRAVRGLDVSLTEIARHTGISYDTVRRFGGKRS